MIKRNKAIKLMMLVSLFIISNLRAQHEIKFMTYNIWMEGKNVSDGFTKIRDVVIESNPDILCFTEVRNFNSQDWTSKVVSELAKSGFTYFSSYAGGDISLMSKYPIISSDLIYNENNSVAKFKVRLQDRDIVVGCAHLDYTYYACYLPRGYNGGMPDWNIIDDGNGQPKPVTDVNYVLNYNLLSKRDEQINAFLNYVKDETSPVILMGDFNEPSNLDWTEKTANMYGHNGLVVPWNNSLLLTSKGFKDAYRVYFPDEVANPGFTYPSFAHGIGSTSWTPKADERERIDYIYYKGNGIYPSLVSLVGPKVAYVYNQPDSSGVSNENFIGSNLAWPSDHKAVFAKLVFPKKRDSTTIKIMGSSFIEENHESNYTCILNYSDSTFKDITNDVKWSENSINATISSGGLLKVNNVESYDTVVLTATYGDLIDTAQVVIVSSNNIDNSEVRNDCFMVFPNPTNGKIQFTNNRNFEYMEIYDIQGRAIFKNHFINEFDFSDYVEGLYFVKFYLKGRESEGIKTIVKK